MVPTITREQYLEMLKTQDICYQGYSEERLYEDPDDWVEDASPLNNEDCYWIVQNAKNIEVYEKDRFRIRPAWAKEYICDHAYNNYYMEDTDQIVDLDMVDKFCEEFNKKQHWYTSGKLIAHLDLSKEVKEYYMENYEISEEEWNELEKANAIVEK